MIAFATLGTNDLEKSIKFYDTVLFSLGIINVVKTERYVGYAYKKKPEDIKFYIFTPYNQNIATNGNGTMITFLANSKQEVNNFYSIALKNGGLDEGLPGPRHQKDYYAYIRDISGNKICAFFPTT